MLDSLVDLPDTIDSINLINDTIAKTFSLSAQQSFPVRKYASRRSHDKVWFGNDCRRAQKKFLKAK